MTATRTMTDSHVGRTRTPATMTRLITTSPVLGSRTRMMLLILSTQRWSPALAAYGP